MLYHVVLLRPKPGVSDAAVAVARDAVLGLRERIPGIVSIDWGANSSPEGLGRGYELGFVVVFEDVGARDRYLPHPEHQAIVPDLLAVAEQVLVFDLAAAPRPTGTG